MVHSVGHWNHIYTEYCLRLHIQWCNIPLHTHHLALFPGCAPYNMSNTPMCCLGNDILCKNSPRPFIFFTASNWYIYIIAWMGGWYDKVNGEDSPLIQTLRLENFHQGESIQSKYRQGFPISRLVSENSLFCLCRSQLRSNHFNMAGCCMSVSASFLRQRQENILKCLTILPSQIGYD